MTARVTEAALAKAARVAASELLAAGCSDEQVAAVLGHKSSRTVPIYTATVRQMSRAKDAMNKRT